MPARMELAFFDFIPSANGKYFWQGQEFEAISLDVSGLEMRSDGKASAPTLTIANNLNGIQGAISAYCLQCKDFVELNSKL